MGDVGAWASWALAGARATNRVSWSRALCKTDCASAYDDGIAQYAASEGPRGEPRSVPTLHDPRLKWSRTECVHSVMLCNYSGLPSLVKARFELSHAQCLPVKVAQRPPGQPLKLVQHKHLVRFVLRLLEETDGADCLFKFVEVFNSRVHLQQKTSKRDQSPPLSYAS